MKAMLLLLEGLWQWGGLGAAVLPWLFLFVVFVLKVDAFGRVSISGKVI